MKGVKFNFDVENELKDHSIRVKKLKDWHGKIRLLTSMLRKGVLHEDHTKISNLIVGYKTLINFVEYTYNKKMV